MNNAMLLEDSQRHWRWILIAALMCVLASFNIVMPMFVDVTGGVLFGLFIGICVGQVNLIAAWAAIAPGNLLFRLPWSMLLAVLLWYSIVVGIQLQGWFNRSVRWHLDLGEVILVGIILIAGVVVAQIPLWIAGQLFRWKLVCGEAPYHVDRLQFNLRHLLLGMFLLSLVLGAGRAFLPTDRNWNVRMQYELWVILAALTLTNLLITVPCIWGSFAPRYRMLLLAFAWLLYCFVLTLVEFGVLCLILGAPGSDATEVFLTFFVQNLSQCGVVLGSLLLLRAVGLRFIRLSVVR